MFARVTKSQSHQYRETWKNIPNKIIDLQISNHQSPLSSDQSWEPGKLSHSHSLSLDMLNNFCFHVYAQKSLFKVENINAYFLTSSSSAASAPREFANHRAGSQLKIMDESVRSFEAAKMSCTKK